MFTAHLQLKNNNPSLSTTSFFRRENSRLFQRLFVFVILSFCIRRVTATYKSPSINLWRDVGTHYTEGIGPICRIPLRQFPCHALAFSARGTCTGSWYGHTEKILHPFHGLLDSDQLNAHRCFFKCSSQRDFSEMSSLNIIANTGRIHNRQMYACVAALIHMASEY